MTRSTSLLSVAAALAALAILPAYASGQPQTARTRYEDAQARETAVRSTVDAAGADEDAARAALDDARSVISAYQAIVRRYPISGYSDNALFNAAGLADTLHQKFGQAKDRDAAVRLYRRVGAEYPTSSLVQQAESAMARLEPAGAPNGESATAPVVAASPTPAAPAAAPAASAATTAATNASAAQMTATARPHSHALLYT